jgi:hypothetical protein
VKTLILETNLIWSSKLTHILNQHGIECKVENKIPNDLASYQVAILNLASPTFSAETVEKLKSAGLQVIAHAGHKESSLLEKGRLAGCSRVVTNSEMTHKLSEIINEVVNAR